MRTPPFFREQLEAEEARGAQRIQALQEQLGLLRRRYVALVDNRRAEFEALQGDIAGLQRATRQCEQLATRCLARSPSPPPPGMGLLTRGRSPKDQDTCSCCDHCRCNCSRKINSVEVLALRPAVSRLQKVLETCERSLLREEAGGQRLQHSNEQSEGPAGSIAGSEIMGEVGSDT